jgi:hypothetical protein
MEFLSQKNSLESKQKRPITEIEKTEIKRSIKRGKKRKRKSFLTPKEMSKLEGTYLNAMARGKPVESTRELQKIKEELIEKQQETLMASARIQCDIKVDAYDYDKDCKTIINDFSIDSEVSIHTFKDISQCLWFKLIDKKYGVDKALAYTFKAHCLAILFYGMRMGCKVSMYDSNEKPMVIEQNQNIYRPDRKDNKVCLSSLPKGYNSTSINNAVKKFQRYFRVELLLKEDERVDDSLQGILSEISHTSVPLSCYDL